MHINDTNDEYPVFTRTTFYFRLSEMALVGSLVDPLEGHTNITATDLDEGVNAEIKISKLENTGTYLKKRQMSIGRNFKYTFKYVFNKEPCRVQSGHFMIIPFS